MRNYGHSVDNPDDLTFVLEPERFPFKGYFFHAAFHPGAPNPCIKLNGHGVLGLPLNARDVPMILSNTSQAAKQQVQENLLEFSPTKVSFNNSVWNDWINGVCKEISIRLGFKKKDGQRRPQMRLSSLQLSGTGSQ